METVLKIVYVAALAAFFGLAGWIIYGDYTAEPVFATVKIETLNSGSLILPDDYVLLAMVEAPKSYDEVTLFCQQVTTEKIIDCTGGVIGKVIDIPPEYVVISVVSLDNENDDIKFYCRHRETQATSFCLTINGTWRT